MSLKQIHVFFQTNLQLIIFITLLTTALGLRGFRYQAYPFGFDQVQIAKNASRIASGNPTLIGPRTGPANMFTGPLIYYLAAPFTFLVGSAYSTVTVALFISLLTGIGLYILSQKYLSSKNGLIISALWALSPLIIKYDRVPWNPNLTFLAAALTFIPFLKNKKLNWLDAAFIASGVFLGYQAHFSGLLLLPLAGLGLLLKQQHKLIVAPVLGFILTLAPTVLFDLRNDWLNLNGFLQLITNKDKVATYSIFKRLAQNGYIIIETTGKVFFQDSQLGLILSAGVIIWLMFLKQTLLTITQNKKSNLTSWQISFALIWITLTGVAIALYRGSNPEYYFFVILPVLLFIIAKVLIKTQLELWLAILFLGGSSIFQTIEITKNLGLGIGPQQQVVNRIHRIKQKHQIKEIVYDMKQIETLGLKYLLSLNSLTLSDSGAKIHIIYPNPELPYFDQNIAGSIGLWLDPRNDPNKTYFTQDKFIIGLPSGWHFHKSAQSSELAEAEIYLLADNNYETLRSLIVIPKKKLRETGLNFDHKEIQAWIDANQHWKLSNSDQIIGSPHQDNSNLYEFVVIGERIPTLSNIELYH